MELINNNQVPEGYKKTEVGVIPEDWEAKLLGDIFCLKNGFSFKSEYFSSSGPIVLTPGNFNLDGGLYFNERNIKRYSGSFPESMIFKNGDLLVVMTDLTPDCNLLGKPAFVDSEETILHNQRIGKINLLSESIDQFFLYFILLSSPYLKKIKEQATGSTVRHTSNKSIYSISLPIPKTKEEQKAIAQTLSDVDALIVALDKLIAKKRNIKTGTMQQLLTGKTRLPGFDKKWVIKPLGNIADKSIKWSFTGGPFGSNLKSCDYTEQGVQIIQLQNIGDGEFINNSQVFTSEIKADELLSCNIYPGDIILSKMGDPVARACIIPDINPRYLMCSDGIRLCVNKRESDSYFIYSYINSPYFRLLAENASTGSTRKRIGLDSLKKIELSIPPLPEQQAIASILSDMDSEITALEKRRAKTQAIKQGMMQELLTGRTRIIDN